MAAHRPIRIPRTSRGPPGPPPAFAEPTYRRNVAGSQRAFRLAFFFVAALAVVDLVFIALDLSSAEAGRSAVQMGLVSFSELAVVIAIGAVVFCLTPAPRGVEVRPDATIVVGRWGRRRIFDPVGQLPVKVRRHFPAGILSRRPVDMAEIVDRSGRKATYQIEVGLFDAPGSRPVP